MNRARVTSMVVGGEEIWVTLQPLPGNVGFHAAWVQGGKVREAVATGPSYMALGAAVRSARSLANLAGMRPRRPAQHGEARS